MTVTLARRWPSPAESEVVAQLARERSSAEIAINLGLSRSAVESRLRSATERLGLTSRDALRQWAVAHAPMLPGV